MYPYSIYLVLKGPYMGTLGYKYIYIYILYGYMEPLGDGLLTN